MEGRVGAGIGGEKRRRKGNDEYSIHGQRRGERVGRSE